MTRQTGALVLAGGTAFMFGAMLAFGASGAALLFMAILALMMFGGISWAMRTDADATWLPKWVILGFLAKLVGTYARYWMVTVFYSGGDSSRYYRAGLDIAAQWQKGSLPSLRGRGAFGTQVVEWITGGIFAIFTPDLLGGFLMFSMIAFGGQLFLYAAFRRWADPHQLKPYAISIFLLPTYMFWPSSIGKDALVVFAIGGAAYFAARTLEVFEIRWIPGLVAFLGLLGLIRIHVAGLVVGGIVVTGLLAKLPSDVDPIAKVRRLVFVGVGVAAAAAVFTFFPNVFGVEITGEDSLDAFTSDVVRRTSEKGTVAEGGAVTGLTDVPQAIALVLFRPYAFEATEIQHYLAAAETSIFLGLFIWKLPAMLRNWRSWRGNGYVVFSTVYVLGFSIAFSVVRNLGIIARQRGQVLAFFLCLVLALGWEERQTEKPEIPVVRPTAGIAA